MRPVTIKNNQFTNTLWLSQTALALVLLLLIVLVLKVDFRLLALLPLILVVGWYNQQTIKMQSGFRFKLKTTGNMLLYKLDSANDLKANEVEVDGFWQIPQALVIKLKPLHNERTMYLTVFRSVIGREAFSNLLVGLSQANTEQIKYHES